MIEDEDAPNVSKRSMQRRKQKTREEQNKKDLQSREKELQERLRKSETERVRLQEAVTRLENQNQELSQHIT